MATASADKLRAELDELGQKRLQLDADDEALMDEVRALLVKADGVIPVTEAADRLHMHRTTIYRVYKPNGSA